MRDLPDDNLRYPVLVELGGGSGSGFYFRTDNKVFLVTARHVLYNVADKTIPLRDNRLKLTSYDKDLLIETPIELTVDLSVTPVRKNDLKDIVLVEIADIKTGSSETTFVKGVTSLSSGSPQVVVVQSVSLKKFNEVLVSNEVFIIGYPNSLGIPDNPQIESKKPLLRKGIVAGKNSTNGTIILDCPVYFGNSGGIAIEIERVSPFEIKYQVIGVISEFIPFVERLKSLQLGYTNLNFENSGYSVVVPIDTILELTSEKPVVTDSSPV